MKQADNGTTAQRTSAETRQVFGREMDKVEAFDWGMLDQPGQFQMIHKNRLNVDHSYQRDKISAVRVLNIAREWSWLAFGVVIVARRKDGSMWVIDAQHRKLAADKRSDIQQLPCLVFDMEEDVAAEALAFVRANTNRGGVAAFVKFKALVAAGDKAAVACKQMVEEYGYVIASGSGRGQVAFVKSLLSEHKKDEGRPYPVARVAFAFCVRLCDGDAINGRLFSALCFLERVLAKRNTSLKESHNADALLKQQPSVIIAAMDKAVGYFGKGGSRVDAQGVVNLLNKGRRSRKLENIIGVAAEPDNHEGE